MRNALPTFKYEKSLWEKGFCVIGVDEVGRGALAGPLYVGAVCFLGTLRDRKNTHRTLRVREVKETENLGIDDSKKLSPKKREVLAKMIKKLCYCYSIGFVSNKTINNRGIVKAAQIAMRRTINNLIAKIKGAGGEKIYVLIDGFYLKYIKGVGLVNQLGIIKGDQKSISIAAASIIAKAERDHTMIKLDQQYPIYFWKRNKGYGTEKHIKALKNFGKSKLHRDLFLRKIL